MWPMHPHSTTGNNGSSNICNSIKQQQLHFSTNSSKAKYSTTNHSSGIGRINGSSGGGSGSFVGGHFASGVLLR